MRTATVVVIVSMHTSKSKVSPNGHAAGKKRWTDDCRIIKTTTSTLVATTVLCIVRAPVNRGGMLNGVLCMRTVLARMHSMLATVFLRARSMHNTLSSMHIMLILD